MGGILLPASNDARQSSNKDPSAKRVRLDVRETTANTDDGAEKRANVDEHDIQMQRLANTFSGPSMTRSSINAPNASTTTSTHYTDQDPVLSFDYSLQSGVPLSDQHISGPLHSTDWQLKPQNQPQQPQQQHQHQHQQQHKQYPQHQLQQYQAPIDSLGSTDQQVPESSSGTLVIDESGRSKYYGWTAGSEWLKDVSAFGMTPTLNCTARSARCRR